MPARCIAPSVAFSGIGEVLRLKDHRRCFIVATFVPYQHSAHPGASPLSRPSAVVLPGFCRKQSISTTAPESKICPRIGQADHFQACEWVVCIRLAADQFDPAHFFPRACALTCCYRSSSRKGPRWTDWGATRPPIHTVQDRRKWLFWRSIPDKTFAQRRGRRHQKSASGQAIQGLGFTCHRGDSVTDFCRIESSR